ncbi:hypothetical protein DFJ73DRAFT_549866 [Zopfochytrium polystomum]|nr:hypothetical protein DFJ73DRAFT_549866 [Zopfochytrium polystomum]
MSIKGTRMSRSDSKDGRQGSLSDVAVGLAAPASSLLGRKSVTGEPELVEILPVSHYDSSHITVKGSYTVPEPGTYVLLFDNTFSKNTSKKLYFFVNLKDIEHAPRPPTADGLKSVEGWILKKGNKKMQGYAKRWMKIDPNGVLTYSKIQNGESRALISLDQAAVRLDHDHLLIDIDSGQTLLHLKAQSPPDFQLWVSALQEYAEDKNINLETDEDILLREQAAGMLEESDSDIEGVQRKAELLVSTLTKELASLKDIIDTSRGRVDTKTQWKGVTLHL